jgi:hypothetical protein
MPQPINLRTNTGCCFPIALPQQCPPVEIPVAPAGVGVELRFTRPPLFWRGCCAGESPKSEPYFALVPVGVEFFGLESGDGNLALESGDGFLLIE